MNKILFALLLLALPPLQAAPISSASLGKLAAQAAAFGFAVPESPFAVPVPAGQGAPLAQAEPQPEHPGKVYDRELLSRPMNADDAAYCARNAGKHGEDPMVEMRNCWITRNYFLDIYAKTDKTRLPDSVDARYSRSQAELSLLFAKLEIRKLRRELGLPNGS